MNNRNIEIYQSSSFTVEAIYYIPIRQTVITLTRLQPNPRNNSGGMFMWEAVVDLPENLVPKDNIFNLAAKNEIELKDFQRRLEGSQCLYDRIRNKDMPSPYRGSVKNPNLAVILPWKSEHISSIKWDQGFGQNYYKEDVENGLIETFLRVLPDQKEMHYPSCSRHKLRQRKPCSLSNYVLTTGVAFATLGLFAFKTGLVDYIANNFNPGPDLKL